MDAFAEMEKLVALDPGGWHTEKRGIKLATVSYRDTAFFQLEHQYWYVAGGDVTIFMYPGHVELGWWGKRRFNRLLKNLAAHTARGAALTIAKRLVAEAEAEADAVLSEFESDLAAQFAALEQADRKEKRKLAESPVAHGFFKGAMKQLSGRK